MVDDEARARIDEDTARRLARALWGPDAHVDVSRVDPSVLGLHGANPGRPLWSAVAVPKAGPVDPVRWESEAIAVYREKRSAAVRRLVRMLSALHQQETERKRQRRG